MLKKIFFATAIVGAVLTIFSFSPVKAQRAARDNKSIKLQNGHLYMDGKLVYSGFSVYQNNFAFLYFYVPSHGLYTISNKEFSGALETGRFDGKTLSFEIAGTRVSLDSSSPMLQSDSQAWVKYDPDFKLPAKGVVYGYGSNPGIPYKWSEQWKAPQK